MWSGVTVVTKPGSDPISTTDMKSRLRVDYADDDTLIGSLISGAVAMIDGPEGIGVGMMEQTWRKTMDCFPSLIMLPGWPIKSVTSVKYLDVDGVEQTVSASDYRVVVAVEPVRLVPAYGKSWPPARNVIGAVWVDYVVGESSAGDVPADLIDAISLIVGHRYENREAVMVGAQPFEVPLGLDGLLSRYRRGQVAA